MQLSGDDSDRRPRRFAVAWRNETHRRISPIGMLDYGGGIYTFSYVVGAKHVEGFQPLIGFPNFDVIYNSTSLFPFFAQRVVEPRGPEYASYVDALGLPITASALDILERSGGSRKADEIRLTGVPAIAVDGSTEWTFIVRGLRFANASDVEKELALSSLEPGDQLRVIRESPPNPVNPDALVVLGPHDVSLGWIPDLLVEFVATAIRDPRSRLQVEKVNGPAFPSHIRLVARLVGFATPGYRPFAGSEWRLSGLQLASSNL